MLATGLLKMLKRCGSQNQHVGDVLPVERLRGRKIWTVASHALPSKEFTCGGALTEASVIEGDCLRDVRDSDRIAAR